MRILPALFLICACGAANAAALPPEIESARPNAAGVLELKAAKSYKFLDVRRKGEIVAAAAGADMAAQVSFDGGGELWRVQGGEADRLDAWSDARIRLEEKAPRTGRWFASLGMQSMAGGDHPSATLNMRLGSTLYKDRYDLAFSYDYSKPRDSLLSRTSFGLVGRALLPLSRHGGWNVGAQVSGVNNYGVEETRIGAVAGLNVYLPRGSFDITFSLQDKGDYGLLAGYTVYLTR